MATIMCIPTKHELKYLRELHAAGLGTLQILRSISPLGWETCRAAEVAAAGRPLCISPELRDSIKACIADPKGKRLRKS